MNDENMRDRLASNAFSFLRQAAEELELAPKDALIHLCSGLELVMKARLAHEHWSLVADKPGSKTLEEMMGGEFKSVGFQEAIARIEKLVGPTWTSTERALLEKVASHRNKVVHFYHRELEGTDASLLVEVAKEQCRAWAIFEPLLSRTWQSAFHSSQDRIGELDGSFRKNRVYLGVVFESRKEFLQKAREAGKEVRRCSTCELEAMVVGEEPFHVRDGDCAVCGAGYRAVRLECLKCGEAMETVPEDGISCTCGAKMSWEEICAQLGLLAKPGWNCWSCRKYTRGSAFKARKGHQAFCLCCLQRMPSLFQECRGCGSDWLGCDDNYLVSCPLCPEN